MQLETEYSSTFSTQVSCRVQPWVFAAAIRFHIAYFSPGFCVQFFGLGMLQNIGSLQLALSRLPLSARAMLT
jgi:hypothetical protein